FTAPLAAQYEIHSDVSNNLSQRVPADNPARIPPVGANASPSGEPTITPQYANVVEANGSAGPIDTAIGYPNSLVSGSGVILQRASIGSPFASGVPRYFFGDQIAPPTSITSAAGAVTVIADPSTYWRAEPVRAGETLTNPSGDPSLDYRTGNTATIAALPVGTLPNYYYSPHAWRVFANTPGNVQLTWRSRIPDPDSNSYVFYEERFTVSSATLSPIRTIFWTEESFNGPRVSIPSGRIVTVNPVFSNVFPETVDEEYVVVGSSGADPNASASEILRTLWYEKVNGNGELHAYNRVGRILIEYLGELRDDGTHEFLGADIVSIEQAAKAKTLTVELGNEIRPEPDETLIAVPLASAGTADQVGYYGSNPRADGSLAYYAERENDIEDRVVFYWLEAHDASIYLTEGEKPGLEIDWPKYLNKYLQIWPADITDFESYTIGHGGSSVEAGTGLKFEGGKIPSIIFQDAPTGDETILDTVSQRLMVDLGSGGDQLNRTLLKFTGNNGGSWYVRLLAQADDRDAFLEGDGGSALTGTVYVGDRIAPPSTDYSFAGYIASGTSYSPNAYIDPFANGVAEAERGAIIPVNALPGEDNALTVWWFKKVAAPSSEFDDFYTTAKVGRYAVAYRESLTIASESFDSAPIGWSDSATDGIDGIPGRFLGPFAQGSQPSTEKTFSMAGNDANNATVSFTLHRFDSWDHESFTVFINGNQVMNQAFGQDEVVEQLSGNSIFGHIRYEWIIAPVTGSYGNYYGSDHTDEAFQVSIVASSADEPVASALSLGFGSTLNGAISNEAFGIDELSIKVPLPQQIVMASNQGTGSLSSPVANGTIYNQPYPNLPGYNPNEEHALILGGRGYALRDDLNLTDGATAGTDFTSLPRTLIQYTDPDDQRPAMAVYEVLREDSHHTFSYDVTAGTILSAPMPLPLLPLPVDTDGLVKNTEVVPVSGYEDPPSEEYAPATYTPFTYKDRKGYVWVYRGPHNGGVPSLGMKFYYTMRPDFAFPNSEQPAVGTVLPFLRSLDSEGASVGDSVSGESLTVRYYPTWPSNPPTLTVGETLSLPKRGLPAVLGQTSARILYQQSIANTPFSSVTLHDPTRAKSVLINDSRVGLASLPVSLRTTAKNGKTYFQLAQPHLQQRFYFNPNLGDIGGLVLEGKFMDEIAGEDYINLNTLSPADVEALQVLVDSSDPNKTHWDDAILALSPTIEPFMENPASRGTYTVDTSKTTQVGSLDLPEISYSDTAVDSYALTALGKGSGYVTLLFGDGEAFTPQGEPVAMQVIRVSPELYQGDLKTIAASNPLDEQTSLRHSGDFAAHPENFEFQWSYASPLEGMAPATYNYGQRRALGTSTSNTWLPLADPTDSPPTLTYPTSAVQLSRSIQINTASYQSSRRLPGQILKSVAGLDFPDRVANQIVFSANLGSADGFALYVNGVPALAYQIPFGYPVPGTLASQAPRSGLVADRLGRGRRFSLAHAQRGFQQYDRRRRFRRLPIRRSLARLFRHLFHSALPSEALRRSRDWRNLERLDATRLSRELGQARAQWHQSLRPTPDRPLQ
ncbi:MAG: hypothetical protein ACKVI3_06030, partial [Verrucomicrobiia bacterium]